MTLTQTLDCSHLIAPLPSLSPAHLVTDADEEGKTNFLQPVNRGINMFEWRASLSFCWRGGLSDWLHKEPGSMSLHSASACQSVYAKGHLGVRVR